MDTMRTAAMDLSRVLARQIADAQLELPSMPGTAAEVMALCHEETTDAAKLSAVLHRDQAIASSVLRVANSAAHAGQVPCVSLQQAVGRLGQQAVIEIAMAVSVRGRLFGNPACAELLGALWRHSVLTGFYTKEIARLRRRNVEIAFLCGLLHDIGKAVLLDHVDRLAARQGLAMPGEEMLAAVHDQHVAAGVMLATAWKLPDQVAEAIACHHDYASAKHFADMAMTTFLADQISHRIDPSCLAPPVDEAALRAHPVLVGLNLYADQFEALLQMRERALAVTEGLR